MSHADQNEFYGILDNLADGVYITDLEGRIVYWNKGAERLSGFRRYRKLSESSAVITS